jgi:putative phosphoesterase
MRIALISDLHGNLVSLDGVLSDLAKLDIDQILCLGDVAVFGPQPLQVLERLAGLGCPCVMGNHDEYLLNSEVHLENGHTPAWEAENLHWTLNQLGEDGLAQLRSFKTILTIELNPTTRMVCFHGSPRSNEEMILSTTPAPVLDGMLDGLGGSVLAVGHTHVQMMRRHNEILIINPGSVGSAFEQMPFKIPRILPWSEYCVIQADRNVLGIEMRRVQADLDVIHRVIRDSGMPNIAMWLEFWGID